jgi:hypothetical protein
MDASSVPEAVRTGISTIHDVLGNLMDRRDMPNVLVSGLLGPVPDTAEYSPAPEVSRLRCLSLPTDLSEYTDLLKRLMMERLRNAVALKEFEARVVSAICT